MCTEKTSMKKKFLIGGISILAVVCFISLLVFPTHSVNAEESDAKYVATKSGLNLRSAPNKSSKVLVLIPFGGKITVVKSDSKEIFLDGRYGKWVNVKYGNQKGWVFDGFLCSFKPDTIIKVAADHYRERYKGSGRSKEFTDFKDSAVSIENIIGDYIVLRVPTSDGVSSDIDSGGVLWKYDAWHKNFFEAHEIKQANATYLFHLNKDPYPDMIISYGCCNSVYIDVYLGSAYGFRSILSGYGNGFFYYTAGLCGDTEILYGYSETYEDKNEVLSFYKFNCNSDSLEHIGESKIIESEGYIISFDPEKLSLVIKGKKDSKDKSYRLYKPYAKEYPEKIKQLQAGDGVSFKYGTLEDGKRIIIHIEKSQSQPYGAAPSLKEIGS